MASAQSDNEFDVPTQRILSHITNLKQKNEKQHLEIVRLKGELAKSKSNNSRIKRIPKKEESEGENTPAIA